MAIEQFSKKQFEAALPKNLWTHLGLDKGEHCYNVKINEDIFIHIRSSIDNSGFAAETGQDSIRCWLVDKEGKPLSVKIQKYVTRVRGWDARLLDNLRILWNLAKETGYCSDCKVPLSIFKVKSGKNIGKMFANCSKCNNSFKWLKE